MSFSVGIVGLPNVGKSTLFKALTQKDVKISPRPFTTIQPNLGQVFVPDERLEKIAEIVKPEKVTRTLIEFVDIAGLVKGAHKGEGLGNQFLSHIRNCDAILEVVRDFSTSAEGYGEPAKSPTSRSEDGEDEIMQYQLWEPPDPERDIELIKVELLMKDLETIEKIIERLKKETKDPAFAKATAGKKKPGGKLELLERIKEEIVREKLISDIPFNEGEKSEIREFQFLTQKPIVFVVNIGEAPPLKEIKGKEAISLNLKLEEEISEFSEKERKDLGLESQLDKIIKSCYNILDLITFYTILGGKETRAWTLKRNSLAPKAGGVVHTDFEKNFIKALVVSWQKLMESGSWITAKDKGWLQMVGRDYIVQDGDIIEFKI